MGPGGLPEPRRNVGVVGSWLPCGCCAAGEMRVQGKGLRGSGARVGTDVTLVDPGGNASPSTTWRGVVEQLGQAHTRAAKRSK
jgi:hypothetical protein